jgi:uncharacterized protein
MKRGNRPIPNLYRLQVKVQPNAARSAIVGYTSATLKVDIAAPAVDNRANDSLVRFIADRLGIPVSAVTVLRGQTSRTKLLGISLEPESMEQWLAGIAEPKLPPAPRRGPGRELAVKPAPRSE